MYFQYTSIKNVSKNTYQITHLHFGMYLQHFVRKKLPYIHTKFHILFLVCISGNFPFKTSTKIHTILLFYNLVCTCNIFLTKIPSHIHTKLHIFNLVCITIKFPHKISIKIHTILLFCSLVCICNVL